MSHDDIFANMAELIKEKANTGDLPAHLANTKLTQDMKLSDLGLDSLGMLTLVSMLMKITDKYIPDATFDRDFTIRELLNKIDELG